MSFPRILFIVSVGLFAIIGFASIVKKFTRSEPKMAMIAKEKAAPVKPPGPKIVLNPTEGSAIPLVENSDFPSIDRVHQLFTTGPTKLPIVETVSYMSQVPWLKGRPAWIADYASFYSTSRHFIARSLNGKADYFTQKVSAGSSFNVFRKDRNFQFYLLVDLSLCKMGFYYVDLDTNERVLLKAYKVSLGKLAETSSGSLTPLGKYTLGSKIAVYRPGVMGLFQDKQVEMIQVFGTRWLPFEQAKGYGIHGTPLMLKDGKLLEPRDLVGKYATDGCIRMNHEDIEELFSIVITKPTSVEIVKHFKEARLPGVEVATPMR